MKQVVFSFSYVLELKEGRHLFRKGRKKRAQSVLEKDNGAFYQKKISWDQVLLQLDVFNEIKKKLMK